MSVSSAQGLREWLAEIPQLQREYEQSKATHDALPLIVLAGLR